MEILKDLPLSGWPGAIVSLIAIAIYGFYIQKSMKSKAEDLAKSAYERAINAMQAYTKILEVRMENAEKDSVRLSQTIETLCSALEAKGIYITIQGRMVNIREEGVKTTTHVSFTTQEVNDGH